MQNPNEITQNAAICVVGAFGFGMMGLVKTPEQEALFAPFMTVGGVALFVAALLTSVVAIIAMQKQWRVLVALFVAQLVIEAFAIAAVGAVAWTGVINWTVLCSNICGEQIAGPRCDVDTCATSLQRVELVSLALAAAVMLFWALVVAKDLRSANRRRGYTEMSN